MKLTDYSTSWKYGRLSAAALALTLTLTACSSGSNSSSPTSSSPASNSAGSTASASPRPVDRKFDTAVGTDIRSFDPAHTYDASSIPVVPQVVEDLFRFNDKLQAEPALAESFEQPDATTNIYHIRHGVKFHDGTEVKAADVVASLERTRNPKTASEFAFMFANVDKIEPTDDYTVKVTLKKADTLWNSYLATPAGAVVPKAFLEAHAEDIGKPGVGVIGTGPYKYESWTAGTEIVLAKNDSYWDSSRQPGLDQVVFHVIPDENTRLSALQTGELDGLSNFVINGAQISQLRQLEHVKLQEADSFQFDFISINVKRKPLDELAVRQAVNYAFPQKDVVTKLIGEGGAPARDLISPSLWTYEKDIFQKAYDLLPNYEYNVDKAKELLKSSSVPNGFKASLITDNVPARLNVAEAFQASMKPAGIDVEIKQVSTEEYYKARYGQARDYDFIVGGWVPDFPDPLGNLAPLFLSSNNGAGGSNFSNYANPDYDKLIAEANVTYDSAKRAELVTKANSLLVNDLPFVVVDRHKAFFALRDNFTGYTLTPNLYEAFTATIKPAG